MIIYKTVDIEIDSDDIDFSELHISPDDLYEFLNNNYTINEQINLFCRIFQQYNLNIIQDCIRDLLYRMDIDEAKNLIKDLDKDFLTREEYRLRALALQSKRNPK